MSEKAAFHRAICKLAHDGSPAARAILDHILEEAKRILTVVMAEHLNSST